MEDMQQPIEETGLQEPQESSQELSGKQLLDDVIGLNSATTNKTAEEEYDTEESNEIEDVENSTFYSAGELFDLVQSNQPIDESRLTDDTKELLSKMQGFKKSLQGDYTRKTQELAQEKKTVAEQLKILEEQKALSNMANEKGLTVDELVKVDREAKEYLLDVAKQNNIDFDIESDEGKIYLEKVKSDMTNNLLLTKKVERAKENYKIKYGDKYEEVQKKVIANINEMPFSKASIIIKELQYGNIELANAIYDEAYSGLTTVKEEKSLQKPQQTSAPKKEYKQPPSTIGRSDIQAKSTNKKPDYSNFI